MLNPLVSLAILEGEMVDLNIFVNASFSARNQISVAIDIYKGAQKKARFVSKFTPIDKEALLTQLRTKNLTFHLEYISTDWKTKLDDYCASKHLPFFVEDAAYLFSF